MNARPIHLALLLLLATTTGGTANDGPADLAPKTNSTFTYVIVHGAWGGGWAFKEVERLLREDGHTVYRPTLTGQGEKVHLASTNINLTTHITDVANVILWEDLQNIVLIGHSYGGMVVTGVADQLAGRIHHLIYLDAILPEDGESVDSILPLRDGSRFVTNGFLMAPWLDANKPPPHDVPHPANTLSQPISLENQSVTAKLPTTYVLTVENRESPERDGFFRFYERAKARPWTVVIVEGDHNLQWSKPKELVELLEDTP